MLFIIEQKGSSSIETIFFAAICAVMLISMAQLHSFFLSSTKEEISMAYTLNKAIKHETCLEHLKGKFNSGRVLSKTQQKVGIKTYSIDSFLTFVTGDICKP
jgi:hypothetical protein